jgi:tRNA modification GTPase
MLTMTRDDHTIVAQCTPQGSGAIAMIRVSGSQSIQMVDAIARLSSTKKLQSLDSHTIHYGSVVDDNSIVDTVLFLLMKGPRTFTGENVVEITCHNNQLIVHKIVQALLKQGARIADKGEFSKRAVLNDKLDLVQAEAIHDIITSKSDDALKKSLSTLRGSFSALIAEIEEKILQIIVYTEASFEFLDEEMNFSEDIRKRFRVVVDIVQQALQTFDKRRQLYEGVRVALVGKTNVGKSSLFNALINRERAIVTDVAGTTRDTVEALFFKDDLQLTFVDTAGIRKTEDSIERQGIDRSFEEAAQADLILLVVDSQAEYTNEEVKQYTDLLQKYQEKIIVVQNKVDASLEKISFLAGREVIQVSALKKQNIQNLYGEIQKRVRSVIGQDDTPFVLNKRQYDLLLQFHHYLTPVIEKAEISIDYELLSFHLKESLELLSEVTGKTVSEKAFDKVFQSFCVGK